MLQIVYVTLSIFFNVVELDISCTSNERLNIDPINGPAKSK